MTTFVRAKPAFLPLVIVLVVVLVEWNVGSPLSLNKDNHPFLTLKINITSCSNRDEAEQPHQPYFHVLQPLVWPGGGPGRHQPSYA